ncbi:MAG TPA: thioredoxin-like domain-containing protein [Bacteroidota bacterium]|nr:thioredoxin-like domain-containing protein [Bacteroidota bacterium]
MKQFQTNKVQAPEIYGDFWFNSDPLTIHAMQGQVILLCFWDYTSERSLEMVNFVREWARRYDQMGFVAIGIHSPEFSFARDPALVEKAVQRLDIHFPVAADNTQMMRDAYRVQEIPSLFLIGRDGSVYVQHSGEGGYERIDRAIQTLLREAGFRGELPMLIEVSTASEYESSSLERTTPPIRTGYLHGSLGNVEGYSPELPAEYDDARMYVEGKFYAQGHWLAKSDAFEYDGGAEPGYLVARYSGNGANVVMSAKKTGTIVRVLQDGKAIAAEARGEDITVDADGNSTVIVNEPKLFRLVKNQRFGERTLTIIPTERGTTLYALSFGTHPLTLLSSIGRNFFRNN